MISFAGLIRIFSLMIYPILAYGMPVLRSKAIDITAQEPDLSKLLADMWETMYYSNGVGLAAPQIGKGIRLFVMDSAQVFENMEPGDEEAKFPDRPGIKKVFINPRIERLFGEEWVYNEGCLSIPKLREDVRRPTHVEISYLDEQFTPHTEVFEGLTSRIIQHEYDHLEGKLFIDYMKPLRKKLVQRKLHDISSGKVRVDYKMSFPK